MNKTLLQQSIELNEKMLDQITKDTIRFAEELIEIKSMAKKEQESPETIPSDHEKSTKVEKPAFNDLPWDKDEKESNQPEMPKAPDFDPNINMNDFI